MSKIDLSVVITAHDEGLIIHKTLRSVFEALDKVKETGYSYELIIHVDNGDEATIDYLGRYRDDDKIRIFENNFGDAGPSRNFAVKMAKGKYIAFLDGDDLVSPNWFLKAMKLVKSIKGDMIVHPEAILTFGVNQPNVLTIQRDSRKNKEDIKILASANMWCSVALAKKKIFEETPYGKLGDGYGHEDWVFNIETIEKGVVHRFAKDTVLFYRRSEKSRLSSSNRDGAVIPTMKMFDPGKMAEIATPELDRRLAELASNREELENDKDCIEEEVSDRGMFYKLYKMIRNNSFLNYFITPVAKVTLKIMGRLPENSINQGEDMEGESETVVPDFVIEEWVSINHIEPMLYPFKGLLSAVTLYDASTQSLVGEGYCKLAKMVKEKPDYIFIVPWVVRGGADKVLFNYIDALREKHPEWHFAVISTLPVESPWAKNLPDCVDFIDFGNVAVGMWSDQARDELMSRLIVQLGCKKIHIINSEFGYLWVERHKKLIEAEYQLDVSIFAWGYIEGSNYKAVGSYANPYLFEIYPVVRYIFTDNQNMIDYLAEVNGFDRDRMKVLYQPIRDAELVVPRENLYEDGRIKIVWAGRVTPVKMPELVAEIGKNVDENKVSIDVYGELDGCLVEEGVFDDIPALKYCGVYDGFESLPIHEYDLLLYTSLSDGIPNVILEATAAGLPIMASDDGGVREFIKDGETGILVKSYKDYREYVERIEKILDNPEKLKGLAKSAQMLLKKQHSWKKFIGSVMD